MFDIAGFIEGLVALAKKSPLLFVVFLVIIAVFLATPFLWLYRKVASLPGISSVAPQK